MATINGGAGNDKLSGSPVDDVINGLGGNDQLTDDFGNDKLDGGTGNDILIGNSGDDTLIGGAGNDQMFGGLGKDVLIGGAGNDYYIFTDLADSVIEAAGGGTDMVQTGLNNVSLGIFDHVEVLWLEGSANLNAGGSIRSDKIIGNSGSNLLAGNAGNDTLDGGGSNDHLVGGIGNDTYIVNQLNDAVDEETGKGKDTVLAMVSYALAALQEVEVLTLQNGAIDGTGNEFANTINGNDADNELQGLGGNDTLNGAGGNDILNGGSDKDVMVGGKGDDSYFVDNAGDKVTEVANQGKDSVFSYLAAYTLAANIEGLQLSLTSIGGTGNALNNTIGGNDLNNALDGSGGNDTLIGGIGADTLLGGAGNDELGGGFDGDKLDGGAGNDTLDGSVGVDTMIGGAGNDSFFVNALSDVVTELAGGGTDLVQATIDGFALASNVENLKLLGSSGLSGVGNVLNNVITGNGGANTLDGGKGNDTLDGGLGIDNLIGGEGNDVYFVDSVNDVVQEAVGKGKDTVFSTSDFSIALGQEIEILTLTGTGDIAGTGNAFANTINGNARDNNLSGHDSNDTLNGGDGNDNLNGGNGNDIMTGGKGDDQYQVHNAGDKVTEAAGQGNDRVFVGTANYTLSANVENALLLVEGLNLVGNALGNGVQANSEANKLDGAGGDDSLEGGFENDTLIGGAGNDMLEGGFDDDSLAGGTGNDTLDGGLGSDAMTGGAGNDIFIVDNIFDIVSEAAGGGTDRVETELSGLILAANVENLKLLGSADISGTGNDLSNRLWGNTGKNMLVGGNGNDTLDGAGGADTMKGGAGNDVYFVFSADDVVEEKAGEGKDIVFSRVSFSLNDSLEIETVELSGVSPIVSTGNSFANTITVISNGNANLSGLGGKDTLTGAGGEDVIFGGADNDKLTGGAGDDLLDGGSGKDSMAGGTGNDIYSVADVGDTVTELAGQGDDHVSSLLASYTLGANIEILSLGGGALNGTGNTLHNRMFGNSLDNKLDGGGGIDELNGAGGNDSLLGGLGSDHLNGDSGNDTLKGGADGDFLNGGAGTDVMYGEAGKDGFLYRIDDKAELATLGGDTIIGFQSGVDKIELTDLLNAFGISAANAFSGSHVLLTTMNGIDTQVQFDKDGVGGAGPLTLATVTNATLTTSDLLVDTFFLP